MIQDRTQAARPRPARKGTGARNIVRIAVIEDDSGSRRGLCELLGLSGHRSLAFESAEAFLEYPRRQDASCIVLDLGLPGMQGLELLEALRGPAAPPAIVVTGRGEIPLAVQAMKLGAVDFLEKPVERDSLLAAIDTALERRPEREAKERFARLTPREREVTQRILEGLTTRAIAGELGLSHRTVECHRGRILEKLNAANVAELVRIAVQAQMA